MPPQTASRDFRSCCGFDLRRRGSTHDRCSRARGRDNRHSRQFRRRGERTPPDDLDAAAWRAAMDAKFFSYIHVIDPLIKRMAARGSGVIVNVIGNGGKVASPIHVAGGAANAALMLATAGLANAYAGRGVRVVGINPGLTNTDRVAEGLRAEARLSGTSPDESLKRVASRAFLSAGWSSPKRSRVS